MRPTTCYRNFPSWRRKPGGCFALFFRIVMVAVMVTILKILMLGILMMKQIVYIRTTTVDIIISIMILIVIVREVISR